MKATQREQVKRALLRYQDLPRRERSGYLARLGARDPLVWREVMSLLEQGRRPELDRRQVRAAIRAAVRGMTRGRRSL